MEAGHRVALRQAEAPALALEARATLPAELDRAEMRCRDQLAQDFAEIVPAFHERLDRVHASFADRATETLIRDLEDGADLGAWSCDPSGLRVLLRSSFQSFSRKALAIVEEVYSAAAEELSEIYARGFGLEEGAVALRPPALPMVPPPVSLGQTIALDLRQGGWGGWWRRRRAPAARAAEFAALVAEGTRPMIDSMKAEYGVATLEAARHLLEEFVDEHRRTLTDLVMRDEADAEAVRDRILGPEGLARMEALETAKRTLERFCGEHEHKGDRA
jgi:hypothetical protein